MEDSVMGWFIYRLFFKCFRTDFKPVKWSYTTKHIKDNIVEIQ